MGGSNSRIATRISRSGTAAQKRTIAAGFNLRTGRLKQSATPAQQRAAQRVFRQVRSGQAANSAARRQPQGVAAIRSARNQQQQAANRARLRGD